MSEPPVEASSLEYIYVTGRAVDFEGDPLVGETVVAKPLQKYVVVGREVATRFKGIPDATVGEDGNFVLELIHATGLSYRLSGAGMPVRTLSCDSFAAGSTVEWTADLPPIAGVPPSAVEALQAWILATLADYTPTGGSGGTVTATDTPTAPAEGASASYLVTSAVVWPAGLVWSIDPDGGTAPTITDAALVSLFTVDGTTYAVMGSTYPVPVVPDTTDPTAGALAASSITGTGFTLTVTGATDETALHATPYAFSTDNGATYSAWQASNVYVASGLTSETAYDCVHKVRDAAANETTGAAVEVTTGATATVDAAILALSPIAYWKMDETSGTTMVDSSGNNHDGTYSGPTLGAAAPGTLGTAATFDGTNDLATILAATWMNQQTVTVLAFVRPTRVDGMILASKGSVPEHTPYRLSTNADGVLYVHMSNGSNSPYSVGTADVTDGQWHMVAGVIQATTAGANGVIPYVDGAADTIVASTSPAATMGAWAYDMRLGARYTNPGTFFQGDMAHVAIFDKVLTPAEIAGVYSASGLA